MRVVDILMRLHTSLLGFHIQAPTSVSDGITRLNASKEFLELRDTLDSKTNVDCVRAVAQHWAMRPPDGSWEDDFFMFTLFLALYTGGCPCKDIGWVIYQLEPRWMLADQLVRALYPEMK